MTATLDTIIDQAAADLVSAIQIEELPALPLALLQNEPTPGSS